MVINGCSEELWINFLERGKIIDRHNGIEMPRPVNKLVSGCFASNKNGGKDGRLW